MEQPVGYSLQTAGILQRHRRYALRQCQVRLHTLATDLWYIETEGRPRPSRCMLHVDQHATHDKLSTHNTVCDTDTKQQWQGSRKPTRGQHGSRDKLWQLSIVSTHRHQDQPVSFVAAETKYILHSTHIMGKPTPPTQQLLLHSITTGYTTSQPQPEADCIVLHCCSKQCHVCPTQLRTSTANQAAAKAHCRAIAAAPSNSHSTAATA
jgi:hypothetical protein